MTNKTALTTSTTGSGRSSRAKSTNTTKSMNAHARFIQQMQHLCINNVAYRVGSAAPYESNQLLGL